jgi:3-deoxy-D-manno-octulosonate 8-phosphate phosphatase (KDO 8-P phosphatase)
VIAGRKWAVKAQGAGFGFRIALRGCHLSSRRFQKKVDLHGVRGLTRTLFFWFVGDGKSWRRDVGCRVSSRLRDPTSQRRDVGQPGFWFGRGKIKAMSDLALASLASADVLARARRIKLFLMDVDGTITDGGVCLISTTSADGSTAEVSEMKVFNAQDGQGLTLAHTMGIQTGFITGRKSPAVAKRAAENKVTFVYLGQAKKTQAFEECMEKAGVREDEVCYMGDDLPDIPLAMRAGLAVCVADGAAELKAVCHYTTKRLAGRGTAREVIELILKAQGRWEEAVPLALA